MWNGWTNSVLVFKEDGSDDYEETSSDRISQIYHLVNLACNHASSYDSFALSGYGMWYSGQEILETDSNGCHDHWCYGVGQSSDKPPGRDRSLLSE